MAHTAQSQVPNALLSVRAAALSSNKAKPIQQRSLASHHCLIGEYAREYATP